MHRLRTVTYLQGSDRKGVTNEDRVEVALIRLLKHNLIYRYERTEPFEKIDKKGIDFLIWSTYKRHHFLQVKSSEAGKSYHKIKYADGIPCVVAEKYLSTVDIARIILLELELDTIKFEALVENYQFT